MAGCVEMQVHQSAIMRLMKPEAIVMPIFLHDVDKIVSRND